MIRTMKNLEHRWVAVEWFADKKICAILRTGGFCWCIVLLEQQFVSGKTNLHALKRHQVSVKAASLPQHFLCCHRLDTEPYD